MKKAILATKVGMTQIFNADGILVPVTVLEAGPCVVTQIKTVENDGYSAVQVGFADKKEKVVSKDATGKKSIAHRHGVNKAEMGHFAKAGVTGKEIDGVARKIITDAGYGAYFGHGYGHCIGMECHEAPSCNPGGEKTMEENMVSSAEPGIYLPGKFGVRIEDLVIFTADGCENITQSPKNLRILEI